MAKSNVLVVGMGGIGVIAALNLEAGGKAIVSAVVRSAYDAVMERGFKIDSCNHGQIASWRPTNVLKSVPGVNANPSSNKPFDFVVVCTKNIPDIPPTVADIIAPAITPSHTAIVLIQNGINIEKPLFARFPTNPVVSGVSAISSTETSPGQITQVDPDRIILAAFRNPNLAPAVEALAAARFVELYRASGKAAVEHADDPAPGRWRKLVNNAAFNSLGAITGLDTSSIRLAPGPVPSLLLPLIQEVKAVARAAGVALPAEYEESLLALRGPPYSFFRTSTQQDLERGRYMEVETIVGEPLREAQRLGVPAPTLGFVYSVLKALQIRTKIRRGDLVFGAGQPETKL